MTTARGGAASVPDPAAATPGGSPGAAGRRPLLRLLQLAGPHWRGLVVAGLAAALAELAAVGLMATAAWLISRAAQQPPLHALAVAIVAVRALALGRGALRYTERLLGHEAVLSAMAGIRARVYAALVPLAPNGAAAFRGGGLLTRFVDDVDAAQDLLLRCIVPASVAATLGGCAAGLCAAILPATGAVLAAGLTVAGVLVPLATAALAARSGARAGALRGELSAQTLDLTDGAADLAAFGAAGAAVERAERTSTALTRLERAGSAGTGAGTAAILLLQGLTTVGVTLLALRANAAGQLSETLLAVLALTALTSFEVLVPLPAAARRLVEVRASARRLAVLFDRTPPVPEATHPVSVPDPPFTVELRGVRARYPALDPAGEQPGGRAALNGVDLRLDPGRRVALVGPSGCGKSTVLAVLMRFTDIEEGQAEIGGRNLRACSGAEVRRLITGVTQDAYVFHASIRDNVALAKPGATRQELDEVARRARLLDWIESLPQAWDTVVSSAGETMSGGQRARLVLARALLADPPLLVLDEPTEGLDPATADEVLADLLTAPQGRTTLLVTHHPAGLAAVDEVIVLDGGRVTQRGRHDELIAREGYYRDLCAAQRLTGEAGPAHPFPALAASGSGRAP